MIPPLRYSFDLNSGYLTLTFNDVMNNGRVDPTEITFHGVPDGSDSDNMFTFTGGSTASAHGYTTALLLTEMDLNQIKRRTRLATNLNNTYISISAELISDNTGQPVTPVVTSNSFQAANYTHGTTSPTLSRFVFNTNEGNLTLSFSETVNISTIDPTAITLQNAESLGPIQRK